MPASVLIPPDNRLLGWALNDLTLYGAPGTTGVTIGRAPDDAAALTGPATAFAATDGMAAAPESDRAAAETTAFLDRDDAQAPRPSTTTLGRPADHVAPASTEQHSADAQPSVPQPVGSGSFLQAPVATPLQAATADHGNQDSAGPMPSGSMVEAAQPLTSAATGLADTVSHAADAALNATANGLDAVLPGVVQPLAGVTATLTHDASALLTPAAGGLDAVVPGIVQPLASVAAALPDSLSHAADTVLTAGVDHLDPAGTIDTVVAPLGSAEVVPPGIDTASLASGALDGGALSAFGGSDPAAGLQTLIGMVDSVEAFDLGHLTSSGHEEANPGSILDSLAADEAPSSLLGDHNDAHHLPDDHGIHLGG